MSHATLKAYALWGQDFPTLVLDQIIEAGLVWHLRDNPYLPDDACSYIADRLFQLLTPWLDGQTQYGPREQVAVAVLLAEALCIDDAEVERLRLGQLPVGSIGIDPNPLLDHLNNAAVEFVLVGSQAAGAWGAPKGSDLDICYCDTPENRDRLLQALLPIATHSSPKSCPPFPLLRPVMGTLPKSPASVAHLPDPTSPRTPPTADPADWSVEIRSLDTTYGHIDLLKRLCGVGMYDACLAQSVAIDGTNVLSIASLIDVKWAASRPGDRLHMVQLALAREAHGSPAHGRQGHGLINRVTWLLRDHMYALRHGKPTDPTSLEEAVLQLETSGYPIRWAKGEQEALTLLGLLSSPCTE